MPWLHRTWGERKREASQSTFISGDHYEARRAWHQVPYVIAIHGIPIPSIVDGAEGPASVLGLAELKSLVSKSSALVSQL